MRAAVVSESPVDEAAVAILLAGLLESPVELVKPSNRIRHFGWSDVPRLVESTVRGTYYMGTADAVVTVLDSDLTIVHDLEHPPGSFHSKCRLCHVSRFVENSISQLTPIEGRPLPHIAIGLAVPSIEAWYHCGEDPQFNEAAWVNARKEGRVPYSVAQLKIQIYGTSQPTMSEALLAAQNAAERIVNDGLLPLLESQFPIRFGAFAKAVRTW